MIHVRQTRQTNPLKFDVEIREPDGTTRHRVTMEEAYYERLTSKAVSENRFMIAAARMIVQLLMVGLVLKTVFALASPWVTLLIAILMVLFAGREISKLPRRRKKQRLAPLPTTSYAIRCVVSPLSVRAGRNK